MSKPNEYLINSDYDSLANAEDHTVTLVISGTLAANETKAFTSLVTTETSYPAVQPQVKSTLDSAKTYIIGQFARFDREGSTPSSAAAGYNIFPNFNNISPTVIEVNFRANNPYSETLTLDTETFTITLKGFRTPYAE